MKVAVCDVCITQTTSDGDAPLRLGIWRIKSSSGVAISLCDYHKNITKNKSATEILDMGVKAEGAFYEYQARLLAEAKKSKR